MQCKIYRMLMKAWYNILQILLQGLMPQEIILALIKKKKNIKECGILVMIFDNILLKALYVLRIKF